MAISESNSFIAPDFVTVNDFQVVSPNISHHNSDQIHLLIKSSYYKVSYLVIWGIVHLGQRIQVQYVQ